MDISLINVNVSYKTVTPTWSSQFFATSRFLEHNQRDIFWGGWILPYYAEALVPVMFSE